MIDYVRDLLERVEHRKRVIADTVARLGDEDEQLEAMRNSLVAFIEHPEQALEDGHAVSTKPPAPESQPGSGRTDREGTPAGSEGNPTPASSRSIAGPDGKVECPDCHDRLKPQGIGTHRRVKHGLTGRASRTPAPETTACPECGKEVKTGGLGTHRRQKHGRGRRTTLVKPEPERPPWRESFLCARCPDAFANRQSRDEHQATHPPIPDVGPIRGRPEFQPPLARTGGAS
jgi:hypothetical protein